MRLTIFARLTLAFAAIAAFSVALALGIMEWTVSEDFDRQAQTNLGEAKGAADRLADRDLRQFRKGYLALTVEPRFRAMIESPDILDEIRAATAGGGLSISARATLDDLVRDRRVARVLLLGEKGNVVGAAGDDAALDPAAPGDAPYELTALHGAPLMVARVPIVPVRATTFTGTLVAIEPVDPATTEEWSKLCRAEVAFCAPDEPAPRDDKLEQTVRRLPGLDMRVRLSMHDTREALRDARFRTFEAALAALAAAIAAGLFGSASVARAVGAIKDATARIGSGDLAARTGLVRTDEIGDVARAVDAMAARLASSRARLQAALDGLPHAVLLLARDGEHAIEYANPAFERITGHARQDAIGRAPGAFVVRLEPSAFEGLRTGEPRSRRGGDRRKDGSRYEQEATLAQIRDERGEPGDFVAMVRDVTKEVELENQLRQAQKMEAVGRLAGGVAHDFNNLLTAIIGYSESLLGEGGHDEPTRESISEIRDAGKRAASLTSQLLAFSRKQVLQPKTLDLNALILQMSKMLRRLIGEDVALATDLAPALAPVRVDPGQIEQIVMNLAVNARDAMPSGGRLAISTRDVVLDDASAAAHEGARPGPHVLLEVADTGEGISDDVRAHLFEPFFTTKEPGKGTGLGLSTVYGIVRQSGGAIEVASDVGKGTTFRIYLPRTAGEAAAPAERTAAKIAASGKETVLVVEDEDVVRRLATLALRSAGFEVIDARGGPEAIAAFERAERVDLVLTDVVMPGMPGRELADRLLARRPGLPVLFMSGYTDDAVTRGGELREGTVLLQKPFTPGALVGKVREVLANGGGRAPA